MKQPPLTNLFSIGNFLGGFEIDQCHSKMTVCPRLGEGGGEVLPYMGYIGMRSPKGYGFSAVLVTNRVSILAIFAAILVTNKVSGHKMGIKFLVRSLLG